LFRRNFSSREEKRLRDLPFLLALREISLRNAEYHFVKANFTEKQYRTKAVFRAQKLRIFRAKRGLGEAVFIASKKNQNIFEKNQKNLRKGIDNFFSLW